MRTFHSVYLLLLLCTGFLNAQNNVILQLKSGTPFTVFIKNKPANSSPQAVVLLTGITADTLFTKIRLESGEQFGVTLFLLDKKRHTCDKEFNFILKEEKRSLQPVFMGMYDLDPIEKRK